MEFFETAIAAVLFGLLLANCGILIGGLTAVCTAPWIRSSMAIRFLTSVAPAGLEGRVALLVAHVGVLIVYSVGFFIPFGFLIGVGGAAMAVWIPGLWFGGYNLLVALGVLVIAPAFGIDWNDGEYGWRVAGTWCTFQFVHAGAVSVIGFGVMLVVLVALVGVV